MTAAIHLATEIVVGLMQGQVGNPEESVYIKAGDWFVLSHLGFFFGALLLFALGGWRIWRRTTRPQPHIKLIMEVAQAEDQQQRQMQKGCKTGEIAQGEVLADWQKEGDWWKNK